MTPLLLDSHTFLWFVWDDPKLNPASKSLIEATGNLKLVSIATCWEIAIKVGLKKLDLGESSQTFLPRELARNNFRLLQISLEHATTVETMPLHHRDPFDRIIIAQAQCEGLTIVSADEVFDRYGVERHW